MFRIAALARTLVATLSAAIAIVFLIGPAQAEPPVAGAGYGATPVSECKTDLSLLNQITGWQTSWPAEWARIASAPGNSAAQEAILLRWHQAPAALESDLMSLRSGAKAKRTAPRAVALRVRQQVRDLVRRLDDPSAEYYSKAEGSFSNEWRKLLRNSIVPALTRYEAFLSDQYLPATSDKSALALLDDGGKCFSEAARFWTTLTLTGDEIERAGNRIIDDVRERLLSLSDTDENIGEILERLRESSRATSLTSEELVSLSEKALQRAEGKLDEWFMASPQSDIGVVPMAEHMRDSFPAGFYQPAEGGHAAYVINPSRPSDRRLMAEVIAFHEALPGRHLFYAYPRDIAGQQFNSGLAEGWAIYAETLADEMSLYSSTLDREGMHAKHLWSASRLVIEPRLHSGRWTRQEAISFMRRTTALPEEEIEVEIDRYLAMPGQSLSYSLGADVILRARSRAFSALGEKFDIRGFHDVVVRPGFRPLSEVEADVDAWVKSRSGDASSTGGRQ